MKDVQSSRTTPLKDLGELLANEVEIVPGVTIGAWLAGRPLRALDLPMVASVLTRNLVALHTAHLAEEFPLVSSAIEMQRRRAQRALVAARRAGLRSIDTEELARGLADTRLWQFVPAVVHGDLMPEHILISEDGSKLVALIDWTDMRWDDPAIDLAGVGVELGHIHGVELAVTYAGIVDPGEWFVERIRFREAWAKVIGCLHELISSAQLA